MEDIDKTIEARILRLTMANGDQINGQVNIRRVPGYDRASDLIANNDENFLVLMNATVNSKENETSVRHKTLFVNKDHIIWAAPEDKEI